MAGDYYPSLPSFQRRESSPNAPAAAPAPLNGPRWRTTPSAPCLPHAGDLKGWSRHPQPQGDAEESPDATQQHRSTATGTVEALLLPLPGASYERPPPAYDGTVHPALRSSRSR